MQTPSVDCVVVLGGRLFVCLLWHLSSPCIITFMHAKHSLTLLITDYTHHCILYLVALVNKYIFCYSLSPRCLPLLRALSRFVTSGGSSGIFELLVWETVEVRVWFAYFV